MSDTQSDCVGWPEYATTEYKEKSEKKKEKKEKKKDTFEHICICTILGTCSCHLGTSPGPEIKD